MAGEVAQLVKRVGDMSLLRGVTHVVRHEIELLRGDWRAAVSGLLAEAKGLDPHYALAVHQWAAVWLARVGGPEQAEEVGELLQRAMDEAVEAGCPRCRGELELFSLEARLRTFIDVDRARPELERWDLAHPLPDVRRALQRRWVGALVEARVGSAVASSAELDAVRSESDLRSMAVDAVWLELDRARVLASIDQDAAISAFKAAGDRAGAMGATTLVRLADQGMRALGVRAWRPFRRGRRARSRKPDGPGVGGRSVGRQRRHEPGDRHPLVPREEDRRAPRIECPPQVRSAESHGARRAAARGPRIRRSAGSSPMTPNPRLA